MKHINTFENKNNIDELKRHFEAQQKYFSNEIAITIKKEKK